MHTNLFWVAYLRVDRPDFCTALRGKQSCQRNNRNSTASAERKINEYFDGIGVPRRQPSSEAWAAEATGEEGCVLHCTFAVWRNKWIFHCYCRNFDSSFDPNFHNNHQHTVCCPCKRRSIRIGPFEKSPRGGQTRCWFSGFQNVAFVVRQIATSFGKVKSFSINFRRFCVRFTISAINNDKCSPLTSIKSTFIIHFLPVRARWTKPCEHLSSLTSSLNSLSFSWLLIIWMRFRRCYVISQLKSSVLMLD